MGAVSLKFQFNSYTLEYTRVMILTFKGRRKHF